MQGKGFSNSGALAPPGGLWEHRWGLTPEFLIQWKWLFMQFSFGADAAGLGTAFGGPLAERDVPGRKLGGAWLPGVITTGR